MHKANAMQLQTANVSLDYTSPGGAMPLPAAANLVRDGASEVTFFRLSDTGELLVLLSVAGTPTLFQIPGVGSGSFVKQTITAGTRSPAAVANSKVTAGSIISVVVMQAAPDTTALSFTANVVPGTGYTVVANANATADTVVWSWVERL